MTADTVIAAGRRAAEALMVAACSIVRDGETTLDPVTLEYVDADGIPDPPIYVGRCRLKFGMSRVSKRDTEGQVLAAQQLLLYLPVDGSGDVRVDDQVVITDGGPDPSMTGRSFRVTGLFSQTYATSRRMPIESLS